MARQFVNVSWNNAAEQYDGYQQMNRHVNPNGTAAIHNYSDEALAGRRGKKPSSIPLKQRILPQVSRVEKLTAQMVELCAEYKAGLHTQEDYSLLLSVVATKRVRAEQLLAKAVSVKAPFEMRDVNTTVQQAVNFKKVATLNDDIEKKPKIQLDTIVITGLILCIVIKIITLI